VIFKAGCGLGADERARLTQTIAAAQDSLYSMPNETEITELLSFMFNSMKNGNASNDVEVVAVAYRMVVEGVSHAVLYQAVKDITTGKADDLSKIFFPTAAQFRHYCEKLEKQVRSCISYARRLLDAGEVTPTKRINPEKLAALLGMGHETNKTLH